MSYKIGMVPLVQPHIPDKAYKRCATSPLPKTSLQMQPEHVRPDQKPDPWLLDTEALLRELDRCRELTMQIPISTPTATHLGIRTSVNAQWDLAQRIRYLFHLQCDAQRSTQRAFREAPATHSPKRQTNPIDRQAAARPANARRKA